MARRITNNHNADGVDRRGFLECMAWAGTGVLWTINGGIASGQLADAATGSATGLQFLQISDSHIGFNKEANKDVSATLREAVAKMNAMPAQPAFVLHTGDISHLSKPAEFDMASEILKTIKTDRIFFVPGEHDVLDESGKLYLERYGKGSQGGGWHSFDKNGVHFIGLVNVLNLKAGGLGNLGQEQLDWMKADLQGKSASTPVVVFAHVPLWSIYPAWGWGTDDGAQALAYLKPFGSVTILNGHIHQIVQKVEGNITFHTAMSTAFPQPKAGSAPSPGPMKVPEERLRSLLGVTSVNYVQGKQSLAVIDSPLQLGAAPDGQDSQKQEGEKPNRQAGKANQVGISNFAFQPATLTVSAGTQVEWVNHDGEPHKIVSSGKRFSSPALDTDGKYSFRFTEPGSYPYFCSLHPQMTGKIVVR